MPKIFQRSRQKIVSEELILKILQGHKKEKLCLRDITKLILADKFKSEKEKDEEWTKYYNATAYTVRVLENNKQVKTHYEPGKGTLEKKVVEIVG